MAQRRFSHTAVMLLAVGVLSTASAFAATSSRWLIGARGVYSAYSHQYTYAYQQTANNFRIEDGRGVDAFVDFRSSRLFSWQLSLGQLSFDATQTAVRYYPPPAQSTVVGAGTFRLRTALVSFLIHPLRSESFDLYVGPAAGWSTFDVTVGQSREDEATYGATLGVAARLGRSPWNALLEYRYEKSDHKTVDRDFYGDLGFSAFALGLGYRLP